MSETFDVIVIGAGIAGVSLAAELAGAARVAVLEAEARPGTHATGRSAALMLMHYGPAPVQRLTAAARPALAEPDPAFWPVPILAPRGELFLARPGEERVMAAHLANNPAAEALDGAAAAALVPILRPEAIATAAYDPAAQDIDVDALLQGYLRRLRAAGGQVIPKAPAAALARRDGVWTVRAGAETLAAPVIVNAAGAWADRVATLAAAAPIGIRPLRRSAALLPAPGGHDLSRWPVFGGVTEDWYAKPMGGSLMVSPADEDPVAPQDAFADDMVLAEGLDRFERMVTTPVTRVTHSWAGLRSFAPDRVPVVGFAPDAEGFFWLAGQGGYGIQTAPALARLAADLILSRGPVLPAALIAALSPARFAAAAGG